MLDDVEAVLSVAAVLTIVHGQRAVTDHGVQRRAEAVDVETVGSNRLPGEIAAGAEAADIAGQPKLLARRDLMPKPRTDHGIDPFEIAGSRDSDLARLAEFQAEAPEIDIERAGKAERKVDVLVPVPGAAHQVQRGKAPGRHAPARDLVGDTGLDDELLVVELGVALHIERCPIESSERTLGDVEVTG